MGHIAESSRKRDIYGMNYTNTIPFDVSCRRTNIDGLFSSEISPTKFENSSFWFSRVDVRLCNWGNDASLFLLKDIDVIPGDARVTP